MPLSTVRFYICLILLGAFVNANGRPDITIPDPNCSNLKVQAKVTHTKNNQGDGESEILVSGGRAPYNYIFFKEGGYPIRPKDSESNSIRSLAKGVYFCSVIDQNGCVKKIKITIE